MKLTPRIEKAIRVASVLHRSQERKTNEVPYISHPYSVAFILANYTGDEDTVIAGLLHDVLEDVENYSAEDMEREFGRKVTLIVKEVSEDKDPRDKKENKQTTWQKRKEDYLQHLEEASFEAMMVCCADKIHNLQTMIEGYEKFGETLWEQFNAPRDKQMWYYEKVLEILKQRLNNSIVQELEETFRKLEETIS